MTQRSYLQIFLISFQIVILLSSISYLFCLVRYCCLYLRLIIIYMTKIITSTHFTRGVRYFIVVLCLLIVYPFSSALSKLESIFNYRISVRTYYYFSTTTATKPNDLRSSPSSWPFMSNATEWSRPLNFDLSLNQFKSTEWSLNYFHLVPRHPCSCWGFE